MKDNIYTIKKLCKELNQPRQKIRRRIEKLDINAVNEHTRIYKNEPLEYDHQAFLELAEEFDVLVDSENCTASVQNRTTDSTTDEQHNMTADNDKDKLIKVLEKQLEESNKSRTNLEKLLDQQQQLALLSNKEIQLLKLELEEEKVNKPDLKENKKEKRWWHFFK